LAPPKFFGPSQIFGLATPLFDYRLPNVYLKKSWFRTKP